MMIPTILLCAASFAADSTATDRLSAAGIGRTSQSLQSELESIASASGGRAVLSTLGSSAESRELWLLTLAGEAARAGEQPALLVVAGMDGTRGTTTEVALRMARALLADHAAQLDEVTIYIVPRANPDAAERFRSLPSPRGALNTRPTDDDRDGRIDEDGPRDLNGDGVITLMRQIDPAPGVAAPTLVADEKDPRILREPQRVKGERPRYAVWIEGTDGDSDGAIAEDGVGGTDPDMNFPLRWPEFDRRAGVAPLSEPESMALARFVLEHPRIFAVVTLGRHDNVVTVPDARGRDVTGRLPLLIDEADAPLWSELATLYRDATGQTRAAAAEGAGSFQLWASIHRGLPSFATTMWGRPEPKPEPKPAAAEASKPGEQPGAAQDASSEEAKPEAAAAPAPARPTPPPAGTAPATDAAPAPRGPRGRGRGGPAARVADRASERSATTLLDADSAEWLAYSDTERNGIGFVPWTAFEHPQLGAVEIGGFVPGFRENPPESALDEIAKKQSAWIAKLAAMRPSIEVRGPRVRSLAPGLLEIDLSVVNAGRLPLAMATGEVDGMARPLVMRLTAPIERVRSGRRVETVRSLDPGASLDARWIVEQPVDGSFEIIVEHPVLGAWAVTVRDGAAGEPVRTAGTFTSERVFEPALRDLQRDPPRSAATAAPKAAAAGEVPAPAWNRFYDQEEVGAMLQRFAQARPDLATLESLGESVEGRPMWLLTVTNAATGAAETKPAMYVDGSIHANEIQATETVLYSIWYLLENHGKIPAITQLLDRAAFYFVPTVSPDSRAAWFRDANTPHSHRTGRQPTDDDGDGLVDEDGPNDLNGDGSIGQMWRKDSFGTHRRHPRDPRQLEPVPSEPRADGTREYGDWSFAGEEGIDDDGDGRTNEDPPGVYDMNRNFPSDWQPNGIQRGAGPWPLFYPETRAIGRLLLTRPNIAAGQAFHNAGGMILRGPGAPYREGDYPRSDIAVYDAISRAGIEMLPFYRPLVIHSGLYTVHGGLVNWIAEGLGIVSFTNELWTDKRILQSGQDPTPEQMQRWRDRVLFGTTFTDWKEMDHPEHGRVLVGGGTKFSSRIPPSFMLEEEYHRNFAFVFFHADQMPLLRWESVETKSLGGDLWEVTVAVANDRLIPTRTARAANKRIGEPDRLLIDPGSGVEIISAGHASSRNDRTFTAQRDEPRRLAIEDGVPGHGSRIMRFIAKGPAGGSISLRYEAEKAVDLERTITLDGGAGAAPAP